MADCAALDNRTQSQLPPRLRAGSILVLPPGHDQRGDAESLIERVYLATFGVTVSAHFPTLVGVLDGAGAIIAAAGCRCAADEPLFLEQYLDEPVESAIARASGRAVPRVLIGEIGSLATAGAGAPLLFAGLAGYLSQRGVTHAVATATRRLRRAFAAFGFGAGELGPARRVRLPNEGRDWGRYFEHDPVVVWGRVAAGLQRAEAGATL